MKTNTWVKLKLWRSNGTQRRNKAREIWLQEAEEEEEEREEEEQLQLQLQLAATMLELRNKLRACVLTAYL